MVTVAQSLKQGVDSSHPRLRALYSHLRRRSRILIVKIGVSGLIRPLKLAVTVGLGLGLGLEREQQRKLSTHAQMLNVPYKGS